MDCVFCRINNGEIPSYTIYEDSIVRVFLDINPVSVGHMLIVPKNHTLDLDTIDMDTLNHIFKVAKEMKKLIDSKLKPESLVLTQNNGLLEEVKHYHLHLIPKYENELNITIEEVYNILKK